MAMGFRSELFVFDNETPVLSVIRNYTEADFDELIEIQAECFPPPFSEELWWNREQLQNHVDLFPEGALCIEIEGELAGSLTGLRVDFDPLHPDHTWEEITDRGYIRNHDPKGNTLYIVDISVRPKYRKFGLGKLMMQSMSYIVVEQKLDRLLGGGRMPGYHRYAREMSPEQYVETVLTGELNDPVITFLLKCGRKPVALLENYLEDKESLNYGTLMEWKNPFK